MKLKTLPRTTRPRVAVSHQLSALGKASNFSLHSPGSAGTLRARRQTRRARWKRALPVKEFVLRIALLCATTLAASRPGFTNPQKPVQANRQDFQTLLSSFMDVLNLQLEYQRELADHEIALARLETLTGVNFQ